MGGSGAYREDRARRFEVLRNCQRNPTAKMTNIVGNEMNGNAPITALKSRKKNAEKAKVDKATHAASRAIPTRMLLM
jgi:hypothetical protein